MNEEHENVTIVNTLPNIGERLRQAREAKKYSISEVSAELRLTQESILFLEEQQWEKLHGRAYAQGYFSAYVKFLDLPQEEMLALFSIEYKPKEPEPELREQNEDRKSFSVFIPVLIIIVLLVAFGLVSQQLNNVEPVADDLKQQNMDTFDSSVVEPLTGEISEAKLELVFSESAWVEVSDAQTNILLNKIAQENETVVLTGKAPLNIVISPASAASVVLFNDEEIDILDHTQGRVARFSLGDAL